jgi:Endosomal/lysosomal potassium channel TMEM175
MAADDERPGPGADPRTLALSDGVFAIAMTLLVLSIGMPRPGEHEHLGSDARLLWPGADHRATPGDNWWTVPAILLLAIPLSLLIGGWAMLSWLLLPLAQRA